jgi:hypothetical protein
MKIVAGILLLLALLPSAFARIGENETQCNGRYGTPLTDSYKKGTSRIRCFPSGIRKAMTTKAGKSA